jgi:hypothetical protein
VRNGGTSIALDRFTGAPHFNLRAAGGTIASPTTQVGELGNIGWWSYSGTAFYRNVLLIARAENFVGGFAQTQRLSIGMGDSGSGTDYYYEMVNGNSYFGAGAYGSTPIARVQIKGQGSTSATTSLFVQNSLATTTFSVNDAGELSLPSTAPKITLGGNLTIANTVSPTRQMVYDVSNGNLSIYSGGVGEGYFIGNRLTNSRTSTAFVTPNALNNLGSSSITAYDNDGNIALQASNNGNRSIVLKGLGASGAVLIGNITTANGTSYSAILRADSTTQGFLPPRMTNAQRTAIGTPAVGLMVYCTDAVEGLYVYKSTGWTFVI